MRRRTALGVLLITGTAALAQVRPLAAQQALFPPPPDTAATDSSAAATTSRRLPRATLERLPVDSIEGAFLLEPGVTGSAAGLSMRGAAPGSYSTWLGSFDITPGHRRVRPLVAPNVTGGASVLTGPLPAWAGGSPGALRLALPLGSVGRKSLAWETDRFTSGLGLNRVEGAFTGNTRTSRLFVGGMTFGQKASEPGMDGRDVPVFVPAGTDTTLNLPGLGPTNLPAFALARGDCSLFEESPDPRIAGNYEASCDDDRTPRSARSGYHLLLAADYRIGRASTLEFVTARSRLSSRIFDQASVLAPENTFGRETGSEIHGIALTGPLGPRRQGSWRLSGSKQTDRLTIGPLSAEGEADSRDPAGGFMLGGLGFRWDLESFPVDSVLLDDYRFNRPGTLRNPLSLEDPDLFRLSDELSDGPYALPGFYESGGPRGTLTLFREGRTTLAASATWPSTRNATLTLGGELVRYDVTSYDHRFESQAGSNVYLEKPTRAAVHVEDRFVYDRFELVAGLRYERFDSRGERPLVLDTLAVLPGGAPNPRYGEYYQFPRIASYTDADGFATVRGSVLPLASSRRDEAHSAWNPTVRAAFALGRARLRAGLTRSARMPDFADVYQGINTDLAITAVGQPFGSDLPFERTWMAELGVSQEIGAGVAADLVAFRRTTSGIAVYHLVAMDDPTRQGIAVDVVQADPLGTNRATGLETRIGWSLPGIRGGVAWTWQRVRLGITDEAAIPTLEAPPSWERPHSLVASVDYVAPGGVRSGLFRNSALSLAFRWASGTPFASCEGVTFSDEPCAAPFGGTLRLPAFRQLDLRYERHVGGPRSGATAYLDVRNVFGRRNTVRVFAATGTTSHPDAEEDFRAGALDSYETEGMVNGVLGTSGELELGFAGQGATGCGDWVRPNGTPAPANCVSLVRAESRWGNGDGTFTVAEQSAAADAAFAGFTGSGFHAHPRRVRLGLELSF
jgi:hypothetical protein